MNNSTILLSLKYVRFKQNTQKIQFQFVEWQTDSRKNKFLQVYQRKELII
jgi:hypothetical protein